ncbi:type II restriction endonuclease [Helicobacter sp. 11S03491-1]|uniref:type II restriction endonuclease n=1 Tax=Helicobacter sp. 11S03491-1 TaxID=1476196 RepID=UPI000BA52026|nr:type II restriction endonuclease [Helicobacter sp. 11S03491-1]PAF43041.1 hypothetical protein BKH45_02955 [Helicobacter sp. 11S03491-1]
MKYLEFYDQTFGAKTEDEVFNYLIQNLKPSDISWSYFVNWEKVHRNVREFEICLNILNYLIGKKNFDEEFVRLIQEEPKIIKILPALLANRDSKFDILIDHKNKLLKYEEYDFSIKQPNKNDMKKYLHFMEESGLKDLICEGKIKSLVDYSIGIEVGLDSNGRKNRSGHSMENIAEVFIKDICRKKGYEYLKEANAQKIKDKFDIVVPVDKSSRRYDYVLKTDKELIIFEVNFYNGSGSKLKSTAGEYRNLYDILSHQFKFIWITDGLGWRKTSRPLYETFKHIDYVISLAMLEAGILEVII